jgi:diaminohydroxyphosphoribosylaminopyrimidine deaminase / 5-amino-6-(5-phosphoribosylamino)uracil reductase
MYNVDPSTDRRFMALALDLGRRELGRTWPNPAVGAVLVRETEAGAAIVGRGWTQPGGRPHAEIEALRRAGDAAQGAALYVTLEPCSHRGKSPPCADAIITAGVARVVSAMEDPNPEVFGAGHARLRTQGIKVEIGVGAEEARRAHAGHIRRMRDLRPHVTLKLAVSADDKAGLSGRRPVAVTGDAVRDRVHLMRARNDAILIGIGTALADDPLLTCRLHGMQPRSPVRVVLDRRLRLPPTSRLVRSARETPLWVFADPTAPNNAEQELRAHGVDVARTNIAAGRQSLAVVLKSLAGRGITRLMVEGGPTIAAAFVDADLVDEAVLFRSSRTIGADGIDALEGLPLDVLTQSSNLVRTSKDTIGADSVEFFSRR